MEGWTIKVLFTPGGSLRGAESESKSYQCCGTITQLSETSVEVTELPVRKWTQDYKEWLETLIKPEDKNEAPLLVDYKEAHTDQRVGQGAEGFVGWLGGSKSVEVGGVMFLTLNATLNTCAPVPGPLHHRGAAQQDARDPSGGPRVQVQALNQVLHVQHDTLRQGWAHQALQFARADHPRVLRRPT